MINELTNSFILLAAQTKANLPFLGYILLVLFAVYLLNRLLANRLLVLGIIPRHIIGLPGIVFSPFLHADFNHLFFNAIPLVVLSDFILVHGIDHFLLITASITVLSGALLWCFGKPGIHVGASSVITGYWGYLISNIYEEGSLTAIVLGVISLYYFSGIFLGIFPTKKGVSWEGHLFGLVAGLATAYAATP